MQLFDTKCDACAGGYENMNKVKRETRYDVHQKKISMLLNEGKPLFLNGNLSVPNSESFPQWRFPDYY